jgi:hypothetical protein
MQRFKNVRLVTPVITAVLLFCFAFAASAEQMMRALLGTAPAPVAKPVVVAPAFHPGAPVASIPTP